MIGSTTRATTEQAWQPRGEATGWRGVLIPAGWAAAILAPFFAIGVPMVYGAWKTHADAREAEVLFATAHDRLVADPAGPAVGLEAALHGRDIFMNVCAACHGPQGRGIEGLGRDLVASNFVAWLPDQELHDFIIRGRPDAKPVGMPARAGRDDLSDADLFNVVAYVRGLQDPRRMPELPAYEVSSTPTESQAAAALAAAGGDAELAAWIASGDALFHKTCVACHGKGGVGITGNGKPLVNNAFVRSLDDDGLLAFVKRGRGPSDPASTTGIQMPPKGGNPALSDDDLLDIISYLRTLQGGAVGAAGGS